jgi:hypothetical protein
LFHDQHPIKGCTPDFFPSYIFESYKEEHGLNTEEMKAHMIEVKRRVNQRRRAALKRHVVEQCRLEIGLPACKMDKRTKEEKDKLQTRSNEIIKDVENMYMEYVDRTSIEFNPTKKYKYFALGNTTTRDFDYDTKRIQMEACQKKAALVFLSASIFDFESE